MMKAEFYRLRDKLSEAIKIWHHVLKIDSEKNNDTAALSLAKA